MPIAARPTCNGTNSTARSLTWTKHSAGSYPAHADARYNRGVAYLQKGQSDKALADFDEAVRLNPKDAETRFARGRTYHAMDKSIPPWPISPQRLGSIPATSILW